MQAGVFAICACVQGVRNPNGSKIKTTACHECHITMLILFDKRCELDHAPDEPRLMLLG